LGRSAVRDSNRDHESMVVFEQHGRGEISLDQRDQATGGPPTEWCEDRPALPEALN